MPFIPVPNTVMVELVYNWNNEICENVLYFEAEGVPDLAEMTALAAALSTWWGANMKGIVATSCSLTNVKVTDLNAANSPGIDYSDNMPIVGTASTPSMPNNVSLAIAKRTVFRGRSYRGRIYSVGLTEGAVDNNAVTSTYRNSVLAAWELTKQFTAAGEVFNQVVVSRYSSGAPRAEGLTTPIINFSTDGIIDSQRRRLPGRGT